MNLRLPILTVLGMTVFAFLPLQASPKVTAQNLATNPGNALRAAPGQAQQQEPTSPALSPRDTKVERAKIQMAEKHYEDSIETYQELLRSEPKNAVFMNMMGIAYLDLHNYDQAKKYFQRAIKADKKYSSAVNNLGMVWYVQKNYRKAIREYKRASVIDPGQAGTHANLGFAYYNTNKYIEAAKEFQQALELDPLVFEHTEKVGTMVQDRTVNNHGLFFYTMARVYATKGDAEHCAVYLRKSFDEGYKDVDKAKTDPAFKAVLDDPSVQAVFARITPVEQKTSTVPGA